MHAYQYYVYTSAGLCNAGTCTCASIICQLRPATRPRLLQRRNRGLVTSAPKARFHDYVTIRFRNVWNLITACACAGSRVFNMVRVYTCLTVGPPPWPAFFATSHHSLDIDAFYIQSHLITKNSVDFLLRL